MPQTLTQPLSTCRLLVSPVANLQLDRPASASPATIDRFLQAASEWREDACTHGENITLFYFCGHGIQRSNTEDLILFEDFGGGLGPALRPAVSVDNLFQGMAPTTETQKIARTQLYFIDASRFIDTSRTPGALNDNDRYMFSRPTMIFDEYRSGPDDRSAVIFYSTRPGEISKAGVGDNYTLFTAALLRCLDGEAAEPIEMSRWGITINSLINSLGKIMEKSSRKSLSPQVPVVGGLVRNHVIRYLISPPLVDFTVDIQNLLGPGMLEIENSEGCLVHSASISPEEKVRLALPSGYYAIRANDQASARKASTIAILQPGFSNIHLVMK